MSTADAREVLHPYLGFVVDPARAGFPAVEIGFPGHRSPLAPEVPGRLRIAVTGGSVANWLTTTHGKALKQALADASGREFNQVEIFVLAHGGYKQPQQLMTLAYLGALGARFDWVVNIDGFNEVALHLADNARQGVDLSYPRGWYFRFADFKETRARLAAARIDALLERRAAWDRRFVTGMGRLLRPIQALVDGRFARQLARADARLRALQADGSTFRLVGRGPTYRDEDEMFRQLVALWSCSSIHMDALCRALGARYFHVLQPNQYHEGSKVLAEDERLIAYDPDHAYCHGVRRGYPMLIAAGDVLRAQGIRFFDQTQLFATVAESIYIDKCCHYNERGNQLLAQAIGAAVKTALAQ